MTPDTVFFAFNAVGGLRWRRYIETVQEKSFGSLSEKSIGGVRDQISYCQDDGHARAGGGGDDKEGGGALGDQQEEGNGMDCE